MNIDRPAPKQSMPENALKVFTGKLFDVYQWEQEGYDGQKRIFERVRRDDTAIVIPVTEDGKIILIEEEQPGKKPFIGTVGGRIDEGEDPLFAAKRELLEETGYEAQDWKFLKAHQPMAKMDWAIYTFVANNCKKVSEQNLDGAEKIKPIELSFDAFIETASAENFNEIDIRLRVLEAKADPKKLVILKEDLGL